MFALIAKAFYSPFRNAILATWERAKNDSFAEIKAGLPGDDAAAEVTAALDALPMIEDVAEKRKGKR